MAAYARVGPSDLVCIGIDDDYPIESSMRGIIEYRDQCLIRVERISVPLPQPEYWSADHQHNSYSHPGREVGVPKHETGETLNARWRSFIPSCLVCDPSNALQVAVSDTPNILQGDCHGTGRIDIAEP